ERSLVIAWSGSGRTDAGILRRQVDGVLGGSPQSLDSLGAIKALALAMRDALLAGDLAAFADGLHEGWEHKRRLATGIATPRAARLVTASLLNGGQVLFCGNGGSAADAQHLAAELVGRLALERPAYRAVALTTDTSVLTAIGNDYGYDEVFARQVEASGAP